MSKKPNEERSITALTEAGNYDAFKARMTVTVPLIGKNGFWQSDALGTISLRENVSYRSHEPYVENRSPTDVPASGAAGFNNLNRVFNMTSVRWQPLKNVTIDYALSLAPGRPSSTSVGTRSGACVRADSRSPQGISPKPCNTRVAGFSRLRITTWCSSSR
ncbi:MAG: hypothetical protein U0587_07640 [Candidatus Binatia bacterium]